MENGFCSNGTLTHSLPDFSLDLSLSLRITYKILRKLVSLGSISDAYAFLWANLDKNVISNFLSSTRWLFQIFFREISNSHFLLQSPLCKPYLKKENRHIGGMGLRDLFRCIDSQDYAKKIMMSFCFERKCTFSTPTVRNSMINSSLENSPRNSSEATALFHY